MIINAASDLDAKKWDSLATDNPFMSYAFLSSLEASGCIGGNTGWQPHFFVAEDYSGALPIFAKSHSMGEYVFDNVFANAYQRAGGEYYPKLQGAIPFTPVTSARLLGSCDALLDEAQEFTQKHNTSSLHFTFCTKEEQAALVEKGFLARIDTQFHFTNENYDDFDDFLSTLASRKRKNIRKERESALSAVEIETVTGLEITEQHLDDFYRFYKDTGRRKWGRPYLNRAFFSHLTENMADNVLFFFAKKNGNRIAGAMNIIGEKRLYGRYWGCIEDIPCLHFELSYYQAMEWAIGHKMQVVEAGAQGEHKLARGYVPSTTYSAHYFKEEGFREAVADYLNRERKAVENSQEFLQEMAPFKALSK
jgi:hypothetical protein